LKIVRSKKMERRLVDKIKAFLNRAPRSQDKWHVSDLLYPRKAVFGRLDPQPMTDLQALYFIAGRAHHGILEAALGKWDKAKQDKARADAGEFEKHGIYYSPDLRQPWPWEIKTSRMEYPPDNYEKGYEGYLKQLNQYQACMEDDRGGLLVFFLGLRNGRRKLPALHFYKVLLDKGERAKKVAWMKATAAKMTAAWKKKNVKGLELCPKWMCGDCPWIAKCKPWLDDPKRDYLKEKSH
jgi:hypothetical protein